MKDLIESLITVITVFREVLRFLSSPDLGLGGWGRAKEDLKL